jgi:hypothetical protein
VVFSFHTLSVLLNLVLWNVKKETVKNIVRVGLVRYRNLALDVLRFDPNFTFGIVGDHPC